MRIVLYTASWCKPCQELKPRFAEVKERHPEHDFDIFEVDGRLGEARRLGVVGVPVISAYGKFDEEIDRLNGLVTVERLEEWLNEL